METLTLITENKLHDIISDCLNLGMRVYITTDKNYTDKYFFVSDEKQEYFAYYQAGSSTSLYCASTSTRHNGNRKTGQGYQHFTEEQNYDLKSGKYIKSVYTPEVITAEHIKLTIEQSKVNVLSGKEQNAPHSQIFWSKDTAEVVRRAATK